ncbi:MAG: hypothetical protein HC919_12830 [Oscillatoriales cyanobacterium SM2_2_1]|nr:hypothetical protein [Oscillatoriales cyanobacterium SM2_2_1]
MLPLIGFIVTVVLLLLVSFALSYLFWSDRSKTPQVIAAEVTLFSEQVSRTTTLVAVMAIAALAVYVVTRFYS